MGLRGWKRRKQSMHLSSRREEGEDEKKKKRKGDEGGKAEAKVWRPVALV